MKKLFFRPLACAIALSVLFTTAAYADTPPSNTKKNYTSLGDNISAFSDTINTAQKMSTLFSQLGVSSTTLADVADTGVNLNFQDSPIKSNSFSTLSSNSAYAKAKINFRSTAAKTTYHPNSGNLDPHFPQSTEEQEQRMAYIVADAARLYSTDIGTSQFGTDACYLYLSHYTDNPSYEYGSNPDFTSYLCDVIAPSDAQVYESYIKIGNAVHMASAIANMADIVSSNIDLINSANAVLSGEALEFSEKISSAVTIADDYSNENKNLVTDLNDYTNQIVSTVKNSLGTATTEEQLEAVANEVPKPDSLIELSMDYTKDIVLATLSIAFGGPIFGAALSFGVAMVEECQTFYDYVAFVAMKTSFSSRYADRVMIYYGLE